MSMHVTKEQFIGMTYNDLLGENAKLREENQIIGQVAYELGRNSMADENAKLRKLSAEMYPYAKAFLQEGLILGYIDSKSYDWYLQLHELGVEVGDA